MRKPKPTIVYTYRGQIERGADYHWADGYSETLPSGAILYPWMTKQECRHDAVVHGARAVFARRDGSPA